MNDETENAREVLFQVKDLHVTYRRPGQKAVEAVRGVSFDLHAGDFVKPPHHAPSAVRTHTSRAGAFQRFGTLFAFGPVALSFAYGAYWRR